MRYAEFSTLKWASACLFKSNEQFSNYIVYQGGSKLHFNDDEDDVRFVLYQRGLLDFYSANSLKQQFPLIPVALFWHIILIPNQTVVIAFTS